MTMAAPKRRFTAAEYFVFERSSPEKHEFDHGEILAMSGASSVHVRITGNVYGQLYMRLRGKPCQPYASDLRICMSPGKRYAYADVSVVCGPLEFDAEDERRETVINPRVIVEVLSPSTERYDLTDKLDGYQKLASLREYIVIWQDRPRLQSLLRRGDGSWTLQTHGDLQGIHRLESIEIDLPLSEVYEGVTFPDPPPPPSIG